MLFRLPPSKVIFSHAALEFLVRTLRLIFELHNDRAIEMIDAVSDASNESGSLSPELQDQLKELSKSARVPVVVRKVLDAMAREISALRGENERLKQELSAVSNKCDQKALEPSSPNGAIADVPAKSPLPFEEVERLRSVVVGGVPELKSANTRERVAYDYQSACNIFDFLGVECNPVTVYRLGRPNQGRDRLLKVVLPARVFQRFAVLRAPRLRFFPGGAVFLRKSLTPEQRKRRREERMATSGGGTGAPPPGTVLSEPCTQSVSTNAASSVPGSQGN